MTKLPINENSTIMECYEYFELSHNYAANTRASYYKNCKNFHEFMEEQGIDPIAANIDFNLARKWRSMLENLSYSDATIKLMVASLKRLNSYLINLGVLSNNPFREIDKGLASSENFHSSALTLSELVQVYMKANELNEQGINVLMPTLLAMFSAVRNNTLCKLNVNSISDDGFLKVSNVNSAKNSKTKDLLLPLPSGVLRQTREHIEMLGLQPEDPLLYGLRGYSLKNKQFNAITRRLALEIGWIEEEDLTTDDQIAKENESIIGDKIYRKNGPNFTPHSFRYTLSTLLSEMGVKDDSLEYLLTHSQKSKGSLPRYIHTVKRQQKEIYTGQIILETVLETALELKQNYNIKLNLEQVEYELPQVFESVYRNEEIIVHFKNQLISFAFATAQHELKQGMNTQQPNPYYQQFHFQHRMLDYPAQPSLNPFNEQSSSMVNAIHQLPTHKDTSNNMYSHYNAPNFDFQHTI